MDQVPVNIALIKAYVVFHSTRQCATGGYSRVAQIQANQTQCRSVFASSQQA